MSDTISREGLLKAIKEMNFDFGNDCDDTETIIKMVCEVINSQPAIACNRKIYKVKKESWIDTKCQCGKVFSKSYPDGYYKIPYENRTNYCPDCGIKLDWGEQ